MLLKIILRFHTYENGTEIISNEILSDLTKILSEISKHFNETFSTEILLPKFLAPKFLVIKGGLFSRKCGNTRRHNMHNAVFNS